MEAGADLDSLSASSSQALYTQYQQFKENEIPLKENEKSRIKHLYKMLEVRSCGALCMAPS